MRPSEAMRMAAHPRIVFREGPAGRRPALAGGPEVVDVIGVLVGGDVPDVERAARAAKIMAISPAMVEAALRYYANFTAEIDAELAKRSEQAELEESRWRMAKQRKD